MDTDEGYLTYFPTESPLLGENAFGFKSLILRHLFVLSSILLS
uniref:Uncharacterized protein n=1 Tax=Arundo donax TaxID=35708 RepID=A0A0A9CRA0_ARUDO